MLGRLDLRPVPLENAAGLFWERQRALRNARPHYPSRPHPPPQGRIGRSSAIFPAPRGGRRQFGSSLSGAPRDRDRDYLATCGAGGRLDQRRGRAGERFLRSSDQRSAETERDLETDQRSGATRSRQVLECRARKVEFGALLVSIFSELRMQKPPPTPARPRCRHVHAARRREIATRFLRFSASRARGAPNSVGWGSPVRKSRAPWRI